MGGFEMQGRGLHVLVCGCVVVLRKGCSDLVKDSVCDWLAGWLPGWWHSADKSKEDL